MTENNKKPQVVVTHLIGLIERGRQFTLHFSQTLSVGDPYQIKIGKSLGSAPRSIWRQIWQSQKYYKVYYVVFTVLHFLFYC